MEKATHEAKIHTSWISPDPDYDEAVGQFVRAALHNDPKNRFLSEFRLFHERVVDAGLCTALSQVFLKLTSPGVPDTHQGQELWDFSLVDPDNRRPVDYALRQHLLDSLAARIGSGEEGLPAVARELAGSPRDPRLKLLVTWRTLQFRRRDAQLFRAGCYRPLVAEGSRAEHVCAFAWQCDERPEHVAVVVAPRLLAQLTVPADPAQPTRPPIGSAAWDDTRIVLPEGFDSPLKHLFTGQTHPVHDRRLRLAEILADFPVALLTA